MTTQLNRLQTSQNLIVLDATLSGWRWLEWGDDRFPRWLVPGVQEDGEICIAAHCDRETAGDPGAADFHMTLEEFRAIDAGRARIIIG